MGEEQQSLGADFEESLKQLHEVLRKSRRAVVQRVKPPYNFLRNLGRGKFVAVYAPKDSVDFEGVMNGGVPVYFDAKHSSSLTSFSFSDVRDGQIRYLQQRAVFGAYCFLLVRKAALEGRTARDYVLPINAQGHIAGVVHKRCAVLNEKTRESVKWEELENGGWRCLPGETWVDVVTRQSAAGLWR